VMCLFLRMPVTVKWDEGTGFSGHFIWLWNLHSKKSQCYVVFNHQRIIAFNNIEYY
jgi:hypothetical protein